MYLKTYLIHHIGRSIESDLQQLQCSPRHIPLILNLVRLLKINVTFQIRTNMTHLAPSLHREFSMSINEASVKTALDRSSLFSLQTFDSSILLIICPDFCIKSRCTISRVSRRF